MSTRASSTGMSVLIEQLTAEPTEANWQRLYGVLRHTKLGMQVAELPPYAQNNSEYVTKPGDNLQVQITTGPQGEKLVLAFADVAEWHQADRSINYVEMDSQAVLKMAIGEGYDGVAIHSLQGVHIVIPKTKIVNLFEEWSKGNVLIPEGHKIVAIRPAALASFGRCESGVWIADLGSKGQFSELLTQVEREALQQTGSLIWIVQPIILESAELFDSFVNKLTSMVARTRGVVGQLVVVPFATTRHLSQIQRLAGAGVNVYESAPDGACFMEVHRPTGIVIGMPGKPVAKVA